MANDFLQMQNKRAEESMGQIHIFAIDNQKKTLIRSHSARDDP